MIAEREYRQSVLRGRDMDIARLRCGQGSAVLCSREAWEGELVSVRTEMGTFSVKVPGFRRLFDGFVERRIQHVRFLQGGERAKSKDA